MRAAACTASTVTLVMRAKVASTAATASLGTVVAAVGWPAVALLTALAALALALAAWVIADDGRTCRLSILLGRRDLRR